MTPFWLQPLHLPCVEPHPPAPGVCFSLLAQWRGGPLAHLPVLGPSSMVVHRPLVRSPRALRQQKEGQKQCCQWAGRGQQLRQTLADILIARKLASLTQLAAAPWLDIPQLYSVGLHLAFHLLFSSLPLLSTLKAVGHLSHAALSLFSGSL